MGKIHVAFKIKALIILITGNCVWCSTGFLLITKDFCQSCPPVGSNSVTQTQQRLKLVCKNAKTDITDDIRANSLHLIMLLMY